MEGSGRTAGGMPAAPPQADACQPTRAPEPSTLGGPDPRPASLAVQLAPGRLVPARRSTVPRFHGDGQHRPARHHRRAAPMAGGVRASARGRDDGVAPAAVPVPGRGGPERRRRPRPDGTGTRLGPYRGREPAVQQRTITVLDGQSNRQAGSHIGRDRPTVPYMACKGSGPRSWLRRWPEP